MSDDSTPSGPIRIEREVRFRDLDAMGHVNNAVYATYLEEARAALYRSVLGMTLAEADTVLAHLSIDFLRPITLESPFEVLLWTGPLGSSSIPMEYELRVAGDLMATAETVQVVIDRETGAPRPIPAQWRPRLDQLQRTSASSSTP